MGLCLTLNVFKFDRDVEAALVEVGSRFVIIELLVHLCHLLVDIETVARLLLAPVELTFLEVVTDLCKVVRRLLRLSLHLLVQLLLLEKSRAWLDHRWGRPVSQVKEVDVSLHEALREESDSDVHLVDLLFELEASVLLANVVVRDATSLARLLCLLASDSVLLEHLGLGGRDQLILLLGLGFLDDLADTGVWIYNGLMFHTCFPTYLN